ncbi:alpha/beta hydrolase [Mycobacterium interjectum]|uniref:alpha/beta hydrolase n=1 Tax=Mycobacterium interjectum TaxID=33895 RepID=UPI000A47AE56|nr:alpha/beta hydrolase-fold protein [Mycobacterium interjectum]
MSHVTATAPSAPLGPEHLLASSHISLMHGWVPTTIQIGAAVVLTLAVGWRSRRWRTIWLPLAGVLGGTAAYVTHWYIVDRGLSDEPAPSALWVWIALAGLAAAVLVLGWRSAPPWRRGATVLAVPLCLLCAALALNLWVGYFPTVQAAWNQLTFGPLPDQTDPATVTAMVAQRARPSHGSVVPVVIPSEASHFKHRGELVYLPPEWFARGHHPLPGDSPPPALPTVMMIGGQFNTPADWTRAGNAVKTIDDFAAAHAGKAPVLVFVDSGGAFNNDSECVNGVRGNAADHLTKDVVPYMISKFGVSPDRSNWGVAGWSMGGTCAVDLTVMHPEMFSAFVDVAGDFYPNAGTKAQTIARLFGGNAEAWAAFDPTTVINRHGPYRDVAGWFAISSDGPPAPRRDPSVTDAGAMRLVSRDAAANPSNQTAAAYSLCALGRANGIECAVLPQPGKHDWPFADRAFAAALPWLAGRLGTPGVTRTPLPTASAPPAPSRVVVPAERSSTAGK